MKSDKLKQDLEAAYKKFKEDPSQMFRVKLRRHRAVELQSLLANPEVIDLETFNREVWWFETETRFEDKSIKGEFLGIGAFDPGRLDELKEALSSGKLELHGNYTWGSGSKVYAPNIKNEIDKVNNIRRAFEFLNSQHLEPIEKAIQVMTIPGFGPNITTGLVMMFHPADFAIYNQKSRQAVKLLGGEEGSLEAFQGYVQELKDRLGAQDFLELDWFFYLLAEGLIKITEQEDLAEKMALWRKEHTSEKRISLRMQAEGEARSLLDNKAGSFDEGDLREFLRLINQDFWQGKVRASRFGMAYVGHNTEQLVEQLNEVNKWIERFWTTPETQLRDLLDQFYKRKPIKNAGTAFPSVILYLRDPSRFNLCFKKMVKGLSNLTGFSSRPYSGGFYLNYNDEVTKLREQYDLVPQELDIILCLDEQIAPPIEPSPECPFSLKTFELLRGLHQNPTRDYYNEHKDNFKTYLENPFQEILRLVAEQFPSQMAEYLETEKHLFSRILKNDWGKGGAWDFYWGAFYPKGGKRIKDAQLFLWVNHEILEFGFYIGEYGSEQRKRFLLNCKANQTSLVEILGDSLSDPNLIFGQWERRLEGGLAPKHLKDIEWKDWLSGPAGQGIHVAVVLRKEEVLSLTKQELTDRIANIFRQLFPLVILTASEDPLPEIANYVGLEEIDYEIRPAYSLAEFVDETGFEKSVIAGWEQRLRRKMHVVFQGPPGTGKTYVAERLARLMISETTGFWDIVQFHPAYAYEDFIQGIRPKLAHGGITYELADGRFMEFCRKARLEADGAPCVLIIDEINRAHLSRVFGELMYLLEYRKKEVPLAAGGPSFKIPKNVYLIGTMNTADRSIALVDHALRRRFSFIRLNPHYGVLKEHLEARGYSAGDLIGVLREINNAFDDPNYELGISFFMRDDDQLKTHLPDIWRGEIEPYLEEFFYDQPKKVAPFRWETLVENRLKDWAD